MATNTVDREPLEQPLARLERALIAAYVAGAGERVDDLLAREDDRARRLLAEAALYAAGRLSEVEARSHYLHSLRGEE
jgi:hypothetical protein